MHATFRCLAAIAILAISTTLSAHDTWLETNTGILRQGDSVYVDLKLGNHGNEHRDFKLASKIDLDEGLTLAVRNPAGKHYDILDRAVDTGYAPKEGYWSAKFTAADSGPYMAVHTLDKLHKTTRAIKSAKAFFVVSPKLDEVSSKTDDFSQPLGHKLELVPLTNPITQQGPGMPIAVQLLYEGSPLSNAVVSFVPRGAELVEGFDDRYERRTDDQGQASYTPTEGNLVLVVVHHTEPQQSGDGYDRTAYSATLTIRVPEVCPCCGQ
ncbi:MAG: DUF4198 domain-containing protein [Pirellulales bacterium]